MLKTQNRQGLANFLGAKRGRFQDDAQRERVKVTSHGRAVGAFISALDLDHFDRHKRRERGVHVAGDIPDDLIDWIEAAEYLLPGA